VVAVVAVVVVVVVVVVAAVDDVVVVVVAAVDDVVLAGKGRTASVSGRSLREGNLASPSGSTEVVRMPSSTWSADTGSWSCGSKVSSDTRHMSCCSSPSPSPFRCSEC
jgi:hypothetical protein